MLPLIEVEEITTQAQFDALNINHLLNNVWGLSCSFVVKCRDFVKGK